jgi:hypothetical protein
VCGCPSWLQLKATVIIETCGQVEQAFIGVCGSAGAGAGAGGMAFLLFLFLEYACVHEVMTLLVVVVVAGFSLWSCSFLGGWGRK